jgi:predicted metallo-beta-lactamase superfamily hydrolase
MIIKPIAFESLGVRSQATLVETKDVRIFIDPAVSLAPRRYGLPPHELEVKRLLELSEKITNEAKDADIIIITHYHYDHHDPGYIIPKNIYKNKLVFIKDPQNNINNSQRFRRAPKFLRAIRDLPKSIEIADNKEFKFGSTRLIFSPAVPHGADEKLGYVIQVGIKDNDGTIIVTSDIEGAVKNKHLEFTKIIKPNLIIIDGPLSYLLGTALKKEDLELSIKNMEEIVKNGAQTVIIDHHVLRDLNYKEILKPIIEIGRDLGVKIITAAEYLGLEVQQLEARRKELFTKDYKPAKIPRNVDKLMRSGEY